MNKLDAQIIEDKLKELSVYYTIAPSEIQLKLLIQDLQTIDIDTDTFINSVDYIRRLEEKLFALPSLIGFKKYISIYKEDHGTKSLQTIEDEKEERKKQKIRNIENEEEREYAKQEYILQYKTTEDDQKKWSNMQNEIRKLRAVPMIYWLILAYSKIHKIENKKIIAYSDYPQRFEPIKEKILYFAKQYFEGIEDIEFVDKDELLKQNLTIKNNQKAYYDKKNKMPEMQRNGKNNGFIH